MGGKPRQRLRLSVVSFAKIMEEKLRKNDHKGGWENLSLGQLRRRINGELKELDESISYFLATKWSLEPKEEVQKRTENVKKELADVANFCMMMSERIDILAGD